MIVLGPSPSPRCGSPFLVLIYIRCRMSHLQSSIQFSPRHSRPSSTLTHSLTTHSLTHHSLTRLTDRKPRLCEFRTPKDRKKGKDKKTQKRISARAYLSLCAHHR